MLSNRTKKNKYDEPWDKYADSQDSHESAESDSSEKKQKRTMAKETYQVGPGDDNDFKRFKKGTQYRRVHDDIKLDKPYFDSIKDEPKKIKLRKNLLKYEKELFEIRSSISDIKDKQGDLEEELLAKIENLRNCFSSVRY
jgi:hypothetical protein